MKEYTLAQLAPGECAQVERLCAKAGMRRRMQEIGLIPGTQVCCMFQSPSGDPAAYRIRGALIALRRQDAHTVLVKDVRKGAQEWD